ncbi:hypothetical protein FRC04_012253 [Tulasnella sp. 424]|nr:hypothetical protein FRC04_012253 [Tulasnella sp. 424]
MEVADRIFTFWNTFVRDQIYSIVHGFAPALDERLEDIRTPLPRPLVEYEQKDIRLQDIDYLYKVFQGTPTLPNRADSPFTSFIKALALLRSARVVVANQQDDLSSIMAAAQSFSQSLLGTAENLLEGTNLMDRFLFSSMICSQAALLHLSCATGPSSAPEQVGVASGIADRVRSPYNEQLVRSSQLIKQCLKFALSVLQQHRQQLVGSRTGTRTSLTGVEERISTLTRVINSDW